MGIYRKKMMKRFRTVMMVVGHVADSDGSVKEVEVEKKSWCEVMMEVDSKRVLDVTFWRKCNDEFVLEIEIIRLGFNKD